MLKFIINDFKKRVCNERGTWGMIGSAVIGGAVSYAGSQNWWQGDGDEGGGMPEFYEDPYYGKTQDFLFPYGTNILKGDIPEYYKGIGESGGKEFEDMLGLTKRDVTRGVTEDFARRKVRGARGTDVIARAMGDIGKTLRWEDYSRALKGKEFLFTQGRGITEGVRSSALENQRQRNQYALGITGMTEAENRAKEAMASGTASSATSGIGTAIGSIDWSSIFGGGTTPRGSASSPLKDAGGALDWDWGKRRGL